MNLSIFIIKHKLYYCRGRGSEVDRNIVHRDINDGWDKKERSLQEAQGSHN